MKRIITHILLALAMVLPASASVYTWSRYDLTFETPDDGWVTHSSNTRFEIQWEDMVFTIQLYTKDGSDEKFIKERLQSKALGFNMYDTRLDKAKVKGFKTNLIEGTMPDGTRAVIADLVSDKQNLIVEITANYLFGNREVVDDFIKSFALGRKPKADKEKKHKQKVQSKEDSEAKEKERAREKELQQKRREHKLFDA